MGEKYLIKLKGTKCYLKSITENAINFTTDFNKAKVFVNNMKMDLIDKLSNCEYAARGCGKHKTDHIRLTMDKATWRNLYEEHLDQIQKISDSRWGVHQFQIPLVRKFEIKAQTYNKTGEFPNFECDYFAEDFERLPIFKKEK
jgi:hypothetical protein